MSWSGGETRRFPQVFGGLQLIPPLEKKYQKGILYTSTRPLRILGDHLKSAQSPLQERLLTTIAILFGILPPLLLIYAIYKNDF